MARDDMASNLAAGDNAVASSSSAPAAGSNALGGTATTSMRPDAHTQRYDRQLRLWASSGQASLESARIAVLGASHLGACVLKNLVLPGIGAFELIDGRTIDAADVGNNFFIEDTHDNGKGKSRAQEVARNLGELNTQVEAQGVVMDPAAWVQQTDLDGYTMVIAINQPNSVLLPLADKAWEAKMGVGIPLMAVTGCGLLGRVDVQVREAGIIETHPENTIDLRLTRPWPELEAYAQQYDVDTQDSMERGHIPFIVILLRCLTAWRENHGGELPQPSKDRKTFTAAINAVRRPGADEENIDEAISALGQHIWRPVANGKTFSIPSEIAVLFEDEACEQVHAKSTNFWLLVRALRTFVQEGDGTLPLPGSLPDFKALSETYVEVQRLYRSKARQDLETLRLHLSQTLESVTLPADAIREDELESFARHAGYLKLVRGKSLRKKAQEPSVEALGLAFADPINPVTIPIYLAFEAAQAFYEDAGKRYAGSSAALSRNVCGIAQAQGELADTLNDNPCPVEEDAERLCGLARDSAQRLGLSLDDEQIDAVDEACQEVARGGHSDIPSTSALLGGIAAQEAIKLVTRQYVPMDNTAVYDGIKQAVGVFRL